LPREIIYRHEKILELCEGKTVLSLGCVEHSHLYRERMEKDIFLHSRLVEVASSVVGIDVLQDAIEILRSEFGYECYCADVTKLDKLTLNRKFDIIVAGEIIEHLENPGLMVEGIKRFMHNRSLLVITTPNPYAIRWILMSLLSIPEEKWVWFEHTSWFSRKTLENLMIRMNYDIVFSGYYYYESKNNLVSGRGIWRKAKFLVKMLLRCVTASRHFDGLFLIARLQSL